MEYSTILSEEFKLLSWQIDNLLSLIEEGNTIPFIARYRKEAHGSLDDQKIREISDRYVYLKNFEARKTEIKNLIESQGKLDETIIKALDEAKILSEIEDIYRPFKPKRKTRASIAKEKGYEPLALKILEQNPKLDPYTLAKDYETVEDALKGANDIIAELISEDANIRKRLRYVCFAQGILSSKATKDEDSVYSTYAEFSQPVAKLAGHRVLAIDRGEKEGFLKVSVRLDELRSDNIILGSYVKNSSLCGEFVRVAAKDAYKRLIEPSIEREIRAELTEKAAESAIKVFGMNLRPLLMQPPVKGRVTIGLDPGYRTGCKVAVVDETGKVLDTDVIYPTHGDRKEKEAAEKIKALVKKHSATLMAIGNGTASKETEIFADKLISEENLDVEYMVVSEAGASVYSASKLAAQEYPNFDLTLRSAVSIAHRLQDPLAELVKIDPKAIGVGQYQHDMPQKRLDETLRAVIEDCVNTVGVDLNTASASLLENVAGIGPALAKNIIAYRQENGYFKNRTELKKVSKLGNKAFEQCAGFLRVSESKNILDNTAVHPESYKNAEKVLSACGYSLKKMPENGFSDLQEKAQSVGIEKISEEAEIGVPSLMDIIKELTTPGRDPRDEIEKITLRSDIKDIKDLKNGMELMGTVRNVVDFGVFVDIGVHQDGLVHITQISKKFIKHPSDVLAVGDIIKVWVTSVDVAKKRIALTMLLPTTE